MSYLIINSELLFSPELAISMDQQEKGLMNRTNLPDVMAFLYPEPRINKFWMKNTPMPLDIVFVYDNKVAEICTGEPQSLSIIGSDNPSDLVLEFPYGTCERLNIQVGDDVRLFLNENDLEKCHKHFSFRSR
jgi:uncharacterized membrane protein (UPF0127 family)